MDIITVAKRLAASGLPSACYTRQDFLDELNKRALSEQRNGETKEQAFLRLVTSDAVGVALYKAHRLSPGQDQAARVERPVAKSTPSLDKLRQLARLHHQEHPELTAEMAFSKIYADPANRELVAAERAENRPSAPVEKRGGTAPVADRVAALAGSLARSHPDLTHDAAIAAILQRNPGLAACYRQEQSGQ